MKTHRIPQENLIIEPDRRVEQKDTMEWPTAIHGSPFHAKYECQRKTPHDYSSKKVFIYVSIEPDYKIRQMLNGRWELVTKDNLRLTYEEFREIEFALYGCFSPQDKINDTHEVVKVIGVDEKNVPDDAGIRYGGQRKWHFQLLCEETK